MWFKGSEDVHEDEYVYNAYSYSDTMGVHPKLDAILKSNGWYSEPYDSGTLMAYKL
jgi:hypothetical protein